MSAHPAVSSLTMSAQRANKPLDRVYDVFLSHRKQDEQLIDELVDCIEMELGFTTYVDWKNSADELDRGNVTPDTAAYLRNVMRHASSLIYVVGSDPAGSTWTPWELGFYDGRQSARRIGIYLPKGVHMPTDKLHYLGLYGKPLRESDLEDFLTAAVLDTAALDSAQTDQWARHLTRLASNPLDYTLSVLQWHLGFCANRLTLPQAQGLTLDDQPWDMPVESLPWAGTWLDALRAGQYQVRELRRQLQRVQRGQLPAAVVAGDGASLLSAWNSALARLGAFHRSSWFPGAAAPWLQHGSVNPDVVDSRYTR
ncbi:hypothetical protein [Azohydromonas aeria]|uniref:hypothetical protein n=1 Tax=Azohydromonas aeria TaxID=2590212 RepID=UPI0012F8E897|nr:hypothetical protein [Azohydromonas aeria]